MPNQLKMSKIQSIIALRQQGWSFTRIARELGIHRQTVADHVHEHSKPTKAPTGSEEPKPTKRLPARSIQNRQKRREVRCPVVAAVAIVSRFGK